MAIAKASQSAPEVRRFWPRFRRRSLVLVIAMQIIATLVVGSALIVGGVGDPADARFWVTLLAVGVTIIGMNCMVFYLVSDPLKQLANAVTHVSGERSASTPPNPNIPRLVKNGLQPLIQTIYELSGTPHTRASREDIATELLASAMQDSTTGIIIMGQQREIVYANHAAPISETTDGQHVISLLFANEQSLDDWLDECDQKAVRASREWSRIATAVPGEEGRKLYDISASYQKGSRAEVVITLLDRTHEYSPEDEDLDFIAFAAHELRGPITVIRGYLDVLGDELDDQLDAEQAELLKRLVVSANRLSSYINNILNASRFDRRHLKVHLVETSLADIYDTIRDDMQLRASSQNRLLSVAIPTDLPSIAADQTSLSEVLGNLIDNAIKYSNEGGSVEVAAQLEAERVVVSVTDHGIGMPSNVVSNLFHKFYRSHRSRETVAGTGIGLYISKAIVESHGGTISVRSSEGEGSVFTFSIPTYASVAEKLKDSNNSNEGIISHSGGWIKNHSMYRG